MNTSFQPSPLAIVGIGCLFPKADGPGHFWANIKHGVDCISDVPGTHWNPDDYFDADPKRPDMTYGRRGGFLTPIDFNPLEFGIAPRDLEATDTSQLLGLVAAKQALTDAGVDFTKTRRDKTSVILGVTGTLELVIPLGARLGHPKWKEALKDAGVPQDVAKDVIDRIGESYVPWQENSFPGLLGNVVAGRIANRLDLHGTNCVVDAACASSLSAVHLAAMELQTGKADVVVTGGADTFNDIFMFMCFSKTPALSPTGDSKPFDANGDGTILGEGLGMIVLKRLADAEANGDKIYAVLKGIGTSSDGKGNAIYAPSAEGQKRCLKDAYERAGVDPCTVELVEAHGTGTKVGDAAEASALIDVFSRDAKRSDQPTTAVGSVKSQIGHTKAAAGSASLIKVAMALYNKVLPPTLKVSKPVEPLNAPDSPFYVNGQMRPWLPRAEHPRRAGLSAFGFGGSNFHAVLEEYDPKKAEPDWDGRVEILALSADSPALLAKWLDKLDTWPAFARAAASSRRTFEVNAKCRLLLVAHRDSTDLTKLLGEAKEELASGRAGSRQRPEQGYYYGSGPATGKLAMLFPGQGSQVVGMLRELACTFPEMLESLADADSAMGEPRLSDRIYPPTSFDPDAKQTNDEALRATNVAQPALGAVSWGAYRILSERFGVTAAGFAGHSYGEIVALAAAGRLTPSELFALSKLRGELMAQQRSGDAGTMLAVLALLPDIEKIIREKKLGVVVANKNAPSQTVLSGTTPTIEAAAEAFAAARIRTVKLPVAAAFHSELVAEASKPFRKVLNDISFPNGTAEVFANTTAKAYPADAKASRDLLGFQLANPVEFVEQMRAMVKGGYRTFVEVGPGHTLTKLVEAIVADEKGGVEAFALDASRRGGTFDLAQVLAKLAAHGHAVNLTAWERESACRPAELPTKPVMTVPIGGANYVQPRAKRPPSAPYRNGTAMVAVKSAGLRTMDDNPSALTQALQLNQQTLAALQKLQEQTAQLHKQFLDQQDAAQRTLHAIATQQQAILFPTMATTFAASETSTRTLPIEPPAPKPPEPKRQVEPPVPLAAKAPDSSIAAVLLAVVAEKTGYPVNMLSLDMTLDSDLGVDSIKRVEILSAIQDKLPLAPVVKPEHLGTLHSLKDVANYLAGGTAQLAANIPDPPMTVAISQFMNETLAAPTGSDEIAAILIAVVAEKTGYPVNMLNLDMTLDSDLGVDSIKRVEILSAIQDKLPHAPVVKPEHLGTLHSLKDVANYLAGGTSSVPVSELATKTAHVSTIEMPVVTESILFAKNAVPVATGTGITDLASRNPNQSGVGIGAPDRIDRSIPQPVDLDLTAPRGKVPLAAGAEIWIVGNEEPLPRDVMKLLKSQGFAPKLLPWADPDALKPTGNPAGLLFVAPQKSSTGLSINRLAFRWLQTAAPKLRAAGRSAIVASVVSLDGTFGMGELDPETDPAPGGLAGLVKTVRHEWPDLSAKAIDLEPGFARSDTAGAAAAVAEEFLLVGPVEVGIHAKHRCTLELARTVRRPSPNAITFGAQDVIVVTGGARGVTAEVAACLAETFHPSIILTGRSAAPTGAEPEYLAGIEDESAMKAAMAEHLGPTATPKTVGDLYTKTVAQREIRETLQRIEAAGSKVAYFSCDVANSRAVADLLHRVQVKFGPVTALIHGAGVLADRKIEDLTAEQFDTVYKTKIDGLKNLLDLLGGQELKALVLFSSTTARMGRVGQLAYAVANEVLNKTAQREARRRPNSRVVAINWGPWEGGMVTPALRKVFEGEGVGLIPLADGGEFAVQELNVAGRAAEVIALGKARSSSSRSSISIPATPMNSPSPLGGSNPVISQPEVGSVFERVVDLRTHPVLRSHVIDGRAVLPMALHMEWLAHAALHGNPGLVFHGFNEMRVMNGVMVEENSPSTVRALAGKAQKIDKGYAVPVELRGKRRDGRDILFSRGEVVLANSLPKPPAAAKPPKTQVYPHPLDEVYGQFLFHGEALHGIERVTGVGETAFTGTVFPSPAPTEWFAEPLRGGWFADPLVLDASFQMMILWSYAQHGAGSLPCFAGRYRQYVRAFPTTPVPVVIRITRDNGSFARADIDYLDANGNIVAQLQDYECVIDPQLNQVFRRNRLGAKAAQAV